MTESLLISELRGRCRSCLSGTEHCMYLWLRSISLSFTVQQTEISGAEMETLNWISTHVRHGSEWGGTRLCPPRSTFISGVQSRRQRPTKKGLLSLLIRWQFFWATGMIYVATLFSSFVNILQTTDKAGDGCVNHFWSQSPLNTKSTHFKSITDWIISLCSSSPPALHNAGPVTCSVDHHLGDVHFSTVELWITIKPERHSKNITAHPPQLHISFLISQRLRGDLCFTPKPSRPPGYGSVLHARPSLCHPPSFSALLALTLSSLVSSIIPPGSQEATMISEQQSHSSSDVGWKEKSSEVEHVEWLCVWNMTRLISTQRRFFFFFSDAFSTNQENVYVPVQTGLLME